MLLLGRFGGWPLICDHVVTFRRSRSGKCLSKPPYQCFDQLDIYRNISLTILDDESTKSLIKMKKDIDATNTTDPSMMRTIASTSASTA